MTTPNNTSIRLGMNARLFPINWRPALQEVHFARAAGFRSIQFHGREGGVTAEQLGDPPQLVAEALQAADITPVMEIVVRINSHGRTAAGATPLDVLTANLPVIGALGCERVHWHLAPAEPMNTLQLRALEHEAVPQLAAGVALAQAHGFRFGLEHNEPDIPLFATAEACERALDAVPGLGFVWDLNHTPPEQLEAFLAFAPRTSLLHVSDTPLPDVNYHLPIGMGAIDFAAYFAALAARSYAGPAILEIGGIPKSGGFGRDTDQALTDSLALLTPVMLRG